LHPATPTPERRQYGFRTDWQISNTRARGGEDGISNRERNCGRGQIAEPDPASPKYSVAIEIRILRLPFGELVPS
jgi:hypothetical protein